MADGAQQRGQPPDSRPAPHRCRIPAWSANAASGAEPTRRTSVAREQTDVHTGVRGLSQRLNRHAPLYPPVAQAGLVDRRFHDHRHGAASLLFAHGAPMRVVLEQLGNSQIGLTMNTYAHISPALMRDAANRLDKSLGISA
jgi:integrase